MRTESFQQFAIVAADSAQSLTEQLNAKLYELRNKSPRVTFEGLIARIQYTEERAEVVSLADKYAEAGIDLTCQDCPYFEPALKADGSVDRRIRWGGCPFSESGRVGRDASVCDQLFKQLNSGIIRLTLSE